MTERLAISFEPKIEELERLTAVVEGLAQREHWTENLVFRATLVLEELAINIMKHAHSDGLDLFDVVLASDPDMVTIQIVDSGRPFNPLEDAPDPDLTSSIGDRKIGGLGVHFVRTMMDDIVYHREDDKNHLTMVAHRAK